MTLRRAILWGLDQPMLVVESPDGIWYQNQVAGVSCSQEEMQGVLCPLEVSAEDVEKIEQCPYRPGGQGITSAIADTIDAVLASSPSTAFVHVDRSRLDDSLEAWVFVVIDSVPENDANSVTVPLHGFGAAKGVLTWRNSD